MKPDPQASSDSLESQGGSLRRQAGGVMLDELVSLLREARSANGELYLAALELDDEEIVGRVAEFGPRAHLVLARGPKENAGAERVLREAGTVVIPMSGGRWTMRLRFAVTTREDGTPWKVWTTAGSLGSAGLLAGIGDSLVLDHKEVAAAYLDHWRQAYDATPTGVFPKPRESTRDIVLPGGGHLSLWFAPDPRGAAAAAVEACLRQAQEGILFCRDDVSDSSVTAAIEHARERGVYVSGVGRSAGRITLYDRGQRVMLGAARVSPSGGGVQARLAAQMGRVHELLHRFILVDPFGSAPVVIAGSHAFDFPAGVRVDDDLLIMRGLPELAAQYAVRFAEVLAHFRMRAFAARGRRAGVFALARAPSWQESYFGDEERRKEVEFWVQQTPPPSASRPARRPPAGRGRSTRKAKATARTSAAPKSRPSPKPSSSSSRRSPARKSSARQSAARSPARRKSGARRKK